MAQHLRERADRDGTDLLVVDTGDRIEGNGLYDASTPKGKYTADIFKQQDIDIICSGNHELYKYNASEDEYLITVPNFKGNYLASNLDIYEPKTGERVPLAPRYKKFTTKNQGIRIIAFGFLFDFTGNSNNTVVQPVEETIEESWFQEAIRDREVDLFLVAGHVAARSEEYSRLFRAIREVQWDTPIQFFAGHQHVRDYKKYDAKAYALASGRYMETIGFQSISGLSTSKQSKIASKTSSPKFERRYIDNNLFSFHHHTGLNSTTFSTSHGLNVSALISKARTALNLDSRFGCAPYDLWTNRAPYPSPYSIFSWLEQQVLPDIVYDNKRNGSARIILANTGAIRFDIFKGPFTKDSTYSVSPFATGFRYIKDVPYSIADQLLKLLNNEGPILEQEAPELKRWMLVSPEQLSFKGNSLAEHTGHSPRHGAQQPLGEEPKLIPGYTTHDDAGDDGDDTPHLPIDFYRVPNCIEARVNTSTLGTVAGSYEEKPVEVVDVVFLEFIQPWVLLALKFLGGEYSSDDTYDYMGGEDFTTLLARWVKENWQEDC